MENNKERLLGMIGLCAKAGKLVFGTNMVCEHMRAKKKMFLLLEASDTSENTHKKLCDKSSFYGIKIVKLSYDGEALAKITGKTGSLAVVGITDENLGGAVLGLLP